MSERAFNILAGVGLAVLLAYGVVHWLRSGDDFPADMNRSTLAVQERGYLTAGSLGSGDDHESLGRTAVASMARELDVDVRWAALPASDLLRRLHTDSLDVVVHFDPELPGAESFGLTRPYAERGRSRFVLAVPAGENRLLRVADRAVRRVERRAEP